MHAFVGGVIGLLGASVLWALAGSPAAGAEPESGEKDAALARELSGLARQIERLTSAVDELGQRSGIAAPVSAPVPPRAAESRVEVGDDGSTGIAAELRGLRQDILRLGQVAFADRENLPEHPPPTRHGAVRAFYARCIADQAAALEEVILLSYGAVLERFGKPTRASGKQNWTYVTDQITASGSQNNFVLFFKDGVVFHLQRTNRR